MTSYSPYVWHRLHYTRHHILILWPQTTVFMSSHPLYLTSCPLYLCYHIHCIDDITPNLFLRSHRYNSWHHIHCIRHDSHWICVIAPTRLTISHPIYVWHHTHYMYNIIYPIWGITPIFYEITPHYVWHHMHCILDITPSISDNTATLSVSSRQVYQLYHTNTLYDITHTLCMTSQSVCMTSNEQFMMSHAYRYDITKSIFMTS